MVSPGYHFSPVRFSFHAVFGTTESDPDLLPLLTRQDQDRALTVDRHSVRSPGQRLDQLLAVVTPEQRRNIETILSALDRLVSAICRAGNSLAIPEQARVGIVHSRGASHRITRQSGENVTGIPA